MSVGTYFASFNATLGQLSDAVLEDINEVVFCCRDGLETICAVTPSLSTLTSIVGTVPVEVESALTGRYFIDLDSVNTSAVRFYVDGVGEGEVLINYNYDASNTLTQKKIYKEGSDKFNVVIDRYDGSGLLVSSNEPESQTDRTSWTGSDLTADTVEDSPYRTRWMSKGHKPQSYIYVLGS
mgnify:CR=1 FL=1